MATIGDRNFILYRGVALSQGLICTKGAFGTQQSGVYRGVSSRQGWPLYEGFHCIADPLLACEGQPSDPTVSFIQTMVPAVLTTLYRLTGGTVAEMLRGIRMYFHKLVSVLTAPAAAQAQLGLGHSYSRAKVKFNVHRSDNMIIQSISLLDQLDKDINTFSMRIR